MSTNGHLVKQPIRCAIYTRKSTSEGLEQEFTSLDAQRESCQSYIASQKGEGWVALPELYDDGGFTGANLERPALQKLLNDIREGRIDCVVVYKVDRLSRSLLDFTRLLGLFEQHQVAFVSVTQSFNTNTSMGRLTLNILLSFAQFERELISERTKDKMAAARKKGRWVGGAPILGYTVDATTRRLVINEQEASLVRKIFERYLTDRSLLAVTKWLNSQGQITKRHITKKGRVLGGISFKITHIQAILKNVLYIGKVAYNGQRYAGQHDPIISEELFTKVQDVLAENRQIRRLASNTKQFGLLMQRLTCQACQCAMFHTYTAKDNRRYRYYVCTNAQKRGYDGCPTRSVNAQAIEEAVVACLRQLAQQPQHQTQALERLNADLKRQTVRLAHQIEQAEQRAQSLRQDIEKVKADQSAGRGEEANLQASVKGLMTALEDQERALSSLRVSSATIHEQQLSQQELAEALVVASPAWETLFPQMKRRVLERLLERVEYHGETKLLTLTLSAKGVQVLRAELQGTAEGDAPNKGQAATMRFEFPVDLKRVNLRKLKRAANANTPQLLPGVVRSLVLGHQLQRCLKERQARSFKQVSQWLHISHARVSQLLSLTLLAPEIQEEILLSKETDHLRLTEQRIRQITLEPSWKAQRMLWQALLKGREA